MNCWYTIARLRCRSGRAAESRPSIRTRPQVGRSSPAITRTVEVFPASGAPSCTLISPDCNSKSVVYKCVSAPTRLVTASRRNCMADLLMDHFRFQIPLELLASVGWDVQPQLGTTPQDVIDRSRPFMLAQVVDFRL